MGEVTPRVVVRLADYRRDVWSAADAAWEQTAANAVAALARAERLRATALLSRAEAIARLHFPSDDPRRAASLTLLARWQLGLGNQVQADGLRTEAGQAWAAAEDWVARLRPAGADAAPLADHRRSLRAAAAFTGSLAAGTEDSADAGPAPEPETFARLEPDRRKLVAAVMLATARLEPGDRRTSRVTGF